MRKAIFLLFLLRMALSVQAHRTVTNLNRYWLYQQGDVADGAKENVDESKWTRVSLPHSFSIPYFMSRDFYTGYGWYRKYVDITRKQLTDGRQHTLEFDGVFQVAEVYVNGQLMGKHTGGYTGFEVNVTKALRVGRNVVAVRVNNLWQADVAPRAGEHTFSGGIYRNVRWVEKEAQHIAWYGVGITTPGLEQSAGESSEVSLKVEIVNASNVRKKLTLRTTVLDENGHKVAQASKKVDVDALSDCEVELTTPQVSHPALWSPEHPHLYKVETVLLKGRKEVDRDEETIGFRWTKWTADHGFFLNGKHRFFQGANVHQDQAGWGDAVTEAGMYRDVKLMRDAGFDFIRGSHYPHAPGFVRACDEEGVMFWSEAPFWGIGGFKPDGYWNSSAYPVDSADNEAFEQSALQQLEEMIRIFRNHPSVIAWSMCNEPFFSAKQVIPGVHRLLHRMVERTHELDPTRPAAIGGAQRPMEDVNHVVDLTLDSLSKASMARIPAGSSRRGNNPVLFLVGNSTMRNGTLGNGNNGQWGWGFYAQAFFDPNKITVENQALGGTSSRTFYRRLWPDVRKGLRRGDWVIISIGHNDNGPYDSGRARASIPGIGHDSLQVTIKETGVKETVYTYGEYLRRMVDDCKAVGAQAILMSLTPRDAYDKDGKIVRVNRTFGLWARQVAEQEGVPFVDLNEISAAKLDAYGSWKEQYQFYKDHIHTSRFGAMMNARSAAEGIAACNHPAIEPLKAMMLPLTLPTVKVKREKGKPVLFITGDSTVKNLDKDKDGMWGWGSQAYTVFDPKKITCVNCAKAGRSTRTYLNEGRWDQVYNSLQPGDYVLIQFGHNDIGPIDSLKERGTIATASDTSHVYHLRSNGAYEVVYSFGWYLKKFIQDVREKGATPILVSLTPRNEWKDGHIERRNDTYGKWYREVAKETGVELVDVHNITADYMDKIGQKKARAYYNHDHTHTSLLGARCNALSVAQGLRQISSPLAKYLK